LPDFDPMNQKQPKELRRGWTTGACATAASKAAFSALLEGRFPDPVQITLPKGQTPSFSLAQTILERGTINSENTCQEDYLTSN